MTANEVVYNLPLSNENVTGLLSCTVPAFTITSNSSEP